MLWKAFEIPASNVTDILGAAIIMRNIRCVPRRKNVFVNACIIALCVTRRNHEYNKRYCEICRQDIDVGHLCHMRRLKDVLPAKADKVLYVF